MTNNFLSEEYQRLGKCGDLFLDKYKTDHICDKEINHEGNHRCACEEEWIQTKDAKGENQ